MTEKSMRLARFAPLALIVLALGLALVFRLHEQLSLDVLRARRVELDAFVASNLAAALALYALVYMAAVAVSLPGATILTLTGGFLFGPWLGGGATVIAATLGATGVFLAARTALGDSLQGRVGGWLDRLRAGFGRNAFNYLLVLRLTPIAPFFIVNLAPAFLGVSLRDFFFATLIGIIPGTLVYASVGASLRAAFDAGTAADPAQAARALLFSPALILPILGLVALSLLPVLIKMLRKEKPV